jgi:hypothetical protein
VIEMRETQDYKPQVDLYSNGYARLIKQSEQEAKDQRQLKRCLSMRLSNAIEELIELRDFEVYGDRKLGENLQNIILNSCFE